MIYFTPYKGHTTASFSSQEEMTNYLIKRYNAENITFEKPKKDFYKLQ